MPGTTTLGRGRAGRVEPPAEALRFQPDCDYADAFALVGAPDAPARGWAAAALGSGGELGQRVFGSLVWHGLLGFDLAAPGTDGTMVGWTVAVDEPDLFVLKTDGRLMTGCMVFAIDGSTVTWTTALHYLSPRAEPIWALAQRVHRALAGRLLTRAAATIRSRS
jgi:hypothetical protein